MPPKEKSQNSAPVEGQADAETAAGAAPTTDVDSGPAESSTGTSNGPKRQVAVFGGASTTIRRFTAKDFKDAGVEGEVPDLEFNYETNKHEIDVTDLPDAAIALIKAQPNFKISERSA
jgi:hypothetical protein